VIFKIVGEQYAGQSWNGTLKSGQALHVTTGSPLPKDADAVLPYEVVFSEYGELKVERSARAGANVRRVGEDVKKGEVLAPKGALVTPELMALAAACGIASLKVHRRWRVALAVTGDELVDPGSKPKRGAIFDSNTPLLRALVEQDGAELVTASVRLKDKPAAIRSALAKALKADVLLLAGGMSVGKKDFVKQALEALGVKRVFWKIAQKPGKPFYFGTRQKSLVFGMPGNPAALQACYHAYVKPALQGLSGLKAQPALSKARLAAPLEGRQGMALFLKAERLKNGRLKPLEGQGSHQLKSLAQGQALIYLPAGTGRLRPGAAVWSIAYA
jgi:molybdopterin molybdotransferase